MATRPVRIGNVSGYLGDRYTAVDEAMAGDPVDVLMGDYLAEITLAALAAAARRGKPGWVGYALDQLTPHLPEIARRGIRVVTNAGGFDPEGMAVELRRRISQIDGAAGLRVAHVAGDAVHSRLDEFHFGGHGMEHLDTGAPLKDWGFEPIAANAYLGGFGIAAALGAGADIVVTGRVTDASLTAGPAAWWHGWGPDDVDALAGAVTAGHVIECGAHATGGNFSGFRSVPGMTRPGFPIGEIAADGSSVITKHARDGGAVTVDTVTAQLLYEIQGPRYLNPDVTVHLDTVRLVQQAPDRHGAGPGDRDRAEAEPLRRFAPAVGSLYLQGFPGFHHDGHAPRATEPWPRIEFWPALLESAQLDHHAVLDDGTRVEVPRASRTATPDELAQPVHPEPSGPAPAGAPVELGAFTHARAGDKGGNANVGVWAPDPAHWEWLRATLTTARAAELLPEHRGAIVRHEFPHLRAVHLVLVGLLGTGGSANLRVDQIGKSVGEYLRARHVPGP